MESFRVVEHKVLPQAQQQLGYACIAFQVHVLIFDVTPETLHEDVVQCPPAPVHADGNAMPLEHPGERFRGELATLVAVEDFRVSVGPQSLLQAIHAESAVQRVRDPPSQHFARVPVDPATKYTNPRASRI